LAELRRQPRQDGTVPSELFLSRKVRGNAPALSTDSLTKDEELIDLEKSAPSALNEQAKDKNEAPTMEQAPKKDDTYGERSAKPLTQLKAGDKVHVQHPKSKIWDRWAIVKDKCEFNRSYVLTDCADGKEFRRNRKFLRPVSQAKEEGASGESADTQNAQERIKDNGTDEEGTSSPRRSERIKAIPVSPVYKL
jgi:hypothetical protein